MERGKKERKKMERPVKRFHYGTSILGTPLSSKLEHDGAMFNGIATRHHARIDNVCVLGHKDFAHSFAKKIRGSIEEGDGEILNYSENRKREGGIERNGSRSRCIFLREWI